jgi:hypothetical protein
MDLLDNRDRLFAAPRFAHHLEPLTDVHSVNVFDDRWRHGEKLPQAGSEKTLVVCENDADCGTYR